MDVAVTADDETVTLEALKAMAVIPDLWCPGSLPDDSECGGKAWPAALHSRKKAAYFAAHHQPGCDSSSERSTDQDGDAGHPHAQGTLRPRWKVALIREPTRGPDGRNRPDDHDPGTRTRRTFVDGARGLADETPQKSLTTILFALMSGTLPAGLELQIGGQPPKPIAEVVTHVTAADPAKFTGTEGIFWGEIESHYRTKYEGQMIRLKDAASGVAILVDAALSVRLGLKDPTALIGRHVICFGQYKHPRGAAKPHIRVREISQLAFVPRFRRQ